MPVASGASLSTTGVTQAVTSLQRGTSNCSANPCTATVTGTVASSAGFSGNTVNITGASPSEYNGSFAVTSASGTSFTYLINTSPDRGTTGGSVSSTTSGITAPDLINWVRGQNVKDEDNPSGLTSDVRGYLHGDVLHSRPAIINYNRTGQPTDRDLVVFYGSNDGVLHALKGGRDDADGGELWGFIAPEHFTRFQRMYANTPLWSPTASRPYFFDGPISTMLKGTRDATTRCATHRGYGC